MKLELLTRAYAGILRGAFALTPAWAIGYLYYFLPIPAPRVVSHGFHEIAITAAILLSAFVAWITWRCYQASGESFLRWLTLGFLGFTLVYAPHGLLTRMADHNMWLFLLYGPASRLVMAGCLLVALLHYGEPAEDPSLAVRRGFLWRAAAAFAGIDVLVAMLAHSSFAGSPWLRLSMEGGALACAVAALAVLMWRRINSPVMSIYAISLAIFAQSSLSFILAAPWNHQWWLAHGIFAGGFVFLSYGVIQAFHTTRAFSTIYSQEQLTQQLRISEERFRCVVESSPFPAMLHNEAGDVVFLNPVWAQVTGYALGELPTLADWQARCGIPLAAEGVCLIRCRDGGERHWEIRSTALPRLIDGLQLTLRKVIDVTERHHAEARRVLTERQFFEAQKNESLGVLAGGIAHEFNNLLAQILGATDLAQLKSGAESPLSKYLTQIKASSQRAASRCRLMLAYAGRSHFVPEPLNLAALVEDMADLLRLSIGGSARLNLVMPIQLPSINGDKGQIQQLILNLVINAAEAIGESEGTITLAARLEEAEQVICLDVSDTGCGMDEETASHVFEPFYSTKFDGRGLGLAAVRGMVKAHGGDIEVVSKPGQGALFRLRLPLACAVN